MTTTTSPVPQGDRIVSLDVLRAVALMGIFVMNLPTFAFSPACFFNPTYSGTFEGADRIVWMISHMLFEQKMMAIFSMLFGAGVLLMTSRAERKGARPGALHMRRMGWLLLFGLAHAYIIWEGDILFSYAICGAIVFLFRKLRAKWLFLIGALVLLPPVPLNMGQGYWFGMERQAVTEIQQKIDAGEDISDFEESRLDAWAEMTRDFEPTAEQLAETRASFEGSYMERFDDRAIAAVFMQTYVFFVFVGWRASGMMLLGMAFFKSGFLTGALTRKRYLTIALLGYAIGLPIVYTGMARMQQSGFDFVQTFRFDTNFNYIGSVAVAIAHAALLLALLKTNIRQSLVTILAPYGQMAFTNYIGQSVIGALLFYGYGFGLYEDLTRVGLVGVMLATWTAQIIFSHAWLSAFRFGPLEWLWRCLTYWKLQPIRRS